jgi:hypothetical protein
MDDGADLALALDAFLGEHRRCGELNSLVEDLPGGYMVRMTCNGCGATIARQVRQE